MSSSADRLRAARLLIRVEGGAYAARLLGADETPGVRARVLGVLRWQRALDAVLSSHCRRSLDDLDGEVRTVLRIGLHEGAVLGVPAAVATDAAVHSIRRLGCSSAAALVNAVLRRAMAGWRDELAAAAPDVRLSHPEWLYLRWRERFGADAADRAMAADQQPAPVWVWFLEEHAREGLEQRGVDLSRHRWCPGAWSAPESSRQLLAEVEGGAAYAQDPSSQLVAYVAARLVDSGGRFVDLCAAPGGKAARVVRECDWEVAVACDLGLGRAVMARPLLSGSPQCHVVVCDSTQPPLERQAFDLVLIDAPCSGTGTLRRHPELRWRLRPERIVELAALQRSLLTAGLDLVAPAGVAVYATCSVEPEENERLLEPVPEGFEPVDLETAVPPEVPAIATGAGGIRILPHLDGDGFTIHALRRRDGLIQ